MQIEIIVLLPPDKLTEALALLPSSLFSIKMHR